MFVTVTVLAPARAVDGFASQYSTIRSTEMSTVLRMRVIGQNTGTNPHFICPTVAL